MDIHKLTLAMRPRSSWEAIDLGFLLTQRGWWPICTVWISITLPWFLLLLLVFPPWAATLLLWWAKPLYDRVLLQAFSRTVFGETLSVRQAWAGLPNLCWRSGLLWSLTLGRFAPARSFYLALWVLEGAQGKDYRDRRKVLANDGSGAGAWLTVICIHLEIIITLALLMFVSWLAPANLEFSFTDFFRSDTETGVLLYLALACDYLALSLLEPFYVAAGFSLYLNRRTWLEGWDIELAFHRLAARLTPGAVLLLLGCLWLHPGDNTAQAAEVRVLAPEEECQPRAPATTEVERALEQVLANPDFERCRTRHFWRMKTPQKTELATPKKTPWERLLAQFAEVMEILLWVLAGAAGVWLGVYLYRWLRLMPGHWTTLKRPALPTQVMGLDVRPEGLPADIAGEAWRLWQAGCNDAALSLLYRGALARLVLCAVPLANSATEGDCLAQVAKTQPVARSHFFAELTRAWLQTAYAHRPLADAQMRQLCDHWPQHFGAA